jgi:elongator complex protein 2
VNILYQLGTNVISSLRFGLNLFLRHDQTTRIHGPVSTPQFAQPSWHEIARPQVHGYDVLNVVFIDPLKFASIADEKVMRIFDAPRGFVELSEKLGVAHFAEEKVFLSYLHL